MAGKGSDIGRQTSPLPDVNYLKTHEEFHCKRDSRSRKRVNKQIKLLTE